MISSLDDAIPFFNKWKADETLLDVMFSGALGLEFRVSARVSPRSDSKVLELVNPDSVFILRLSLSGRKFKYVDPVEAAPAERAELEAGGLVCCWEIELSPRDSLGICEVRRD